MKVVGSDLSHNIRIISIPELNIHNANLSIPSARYQEFKDWCSEYGLECRCILTYQDNSMVSVLNMQARHILLLKITWGGR